MQRVSDQRGHRSGTIYWKTWPVFSSGQGRIGTAETLCNARALPSRLSILQMLCTKLLTGREPSHLLHPWRVSPSLARIRVSAGRRWATWWWLGQLEVGLIRCW